MFIIDTDILSIFGKIGEMTLVHELFGTNFGMTPAIMQEISVPIDYGYDYPKDIINTVPIVQINNEMLKHYCFISQNKKLGSGECEAIAYCLEKSGIFISNDKKARDVAKSLHISVVSLPALLKVIILKKIRTKEEVKAIISKIKEADNLKFNILIEQSIFDEYTKFVDPDEFNGSHIHK